MQKKLLSAVITLVALGSLSSVYAVRDGFYMGIQAGQSNTHNGARDAQLSGTTGTTVVTPKNGSKGFGTRLSMGYQWNENFGLEGGYTYLSPTNYDTHGADTCSNPSIHEQAIDFSGKGSVPFANGLGVYGKAGMAIVFTSTSGSLKSSSTCGSSNNTKVRPMLGLGASYDLSQNWVTDVSWSRIMSGGGIQNADLIAIGFSYHFVDKYCGQFLC